MRKNYLPDIKTLQDNLQYNFPGSVVTLEESAKGFRLFIDDHNGNASKIDIENEPIEIDAREFRKLKTGKNHISNLKSHEYCLYMLAVHKNLKGVAEVFGVHETAIQYYFHHYNDILRSKRMEQVKKYYLNTLKTNTLYNRPNRDGVDLRLANAKRDFANQFAVHLSTLYRWEATNEAARMDLLRSEHLVLR